jgi:signal transduction histidine kinase
VRIDISDNGCGFPAEDLPKVTTLFTSKTEASPNAGLGLFITNKIVRTHGGSLGIESRVNEGTTVSVILGKAISRKL